SLSVENLPDGYEVKYTNNGKIAVGKYTVIAQMRKIGTSRYTHSLTATLTIEKAPEIPPEEDTTLKEFEGIIFEDTTFPCDGTVHTLLAQNVPDFATAKYFTNTASQPLESRTARVLITAEGYKALTLTATISIGKGQMFVTAGDLSRTQFVVKPLTPTAVISFGFKEDTFLLQAGAQVANCTGTLAFEYPHETRIAGEYDILPSGYSSEMYDVIYLPGTFTVEEVKTNLVVGGATVNEQGEMLYNGKPMHTVGVNYYSLFNSLLITGGLANPWTKVAQGLATLSDSGVRVIRFNCGVFTKEEAKKYYFDQEETYYAILDKVMDEAARDDILLIPAMFWNDTWMLNYNEEMFNDAWADENSKTMQLIKKMTQEIVTRYQYHPAVLSWEFGNENNLGVDLPNWENHTASVGRIDTQIYSDGMARWADWVKEFDAFDRLIMTGDAQLRNGQYSTYLNKSSWGPDTYEQHVLGLEMFNPGSINTVSVHIYGGYSDLSTPQSVALPGKYLKDRDDLTWEDRFLLTLQATAEVAKLKEMPMAAYVGECGVANGSSFLPGDTKQDRVDRQRAVYDAIGDAVMATGIPIALIWNYDPNIVIYEDDYSVLNPDNLSTSEMETAYYQKFGQHGNGSGIEWSWNENYEKGKAALASIQEYNEKLRIKYGSF
ncbi:MAG: cellulase family glycosylhydrolase, partial [Clostridia bacterium]|nr:cellulase family glycosylhydrolase [Clostridia bacterium]